MHMHYLACNPKTYMHYSMVGSDNLDFNCFAYASRRTARAVTNYFNQRLAPFDLNVAQFGLLAAVVKMPGSTLAAIGEAMLLDDSTMARNFNVLERRGLVEGEGGRGRGGKRISLTKEGRALYEEALRVWQITNRKIARVLGPAASEAGQTFLRELASASEKLRLKDDTASG
jgi:DNA-binding MarR family transcriptional regulator